MTTASQNTKAIAAAVAASAVKWRTSLRILEKEYDTFGAVLQITTSGGDKLPYDSLFAAAAKKRRPQNNKGGKAPITITLPSGTAVCRCELDKDSDAFAILESARAAFGMLPKVSTLAVDIRLPDNPACLVFYAALVYFAKLPGGVDDAPKMVFAGCRRVNPVFESRITAEANTIARVLTKLPPNILTPESFAGYAAAAAKKAGMKAEVYSTAQLKKHNAGLFLAVARASSSPPFLLRLSHKPKKAKTKITLIGKGITFDTGGVNVKPARHMRGMAKDMAGAAAVLAASLAAARECLPVEINAWLAIADNVISNNAYHPDEVITAANNKSVEIVHSDAEGRMVLADTLALAAKRDKADKIITLATLTGTMHIALGERMSGFFADDESDKLMTLAAAAECGERFNWFAAPADYGKELKSPAADIKQCTENGIADHIMAVRFLREFADDKASWQHWDLSAASCEGGLAAAPGPVTGFGAASLLSLLRRWAA
ncbi:MAG: leucyl aminopeptidase family protein [Gammaproteobacteria bacterium]